MDLPNDDALRWIVQSYASLRAAHGEAIDAPELLLPTGDFFPDHFERNAESVVTLLKRMIGYAPIADDVPLAIRFIEADGGGGGGGCGSGACGTGGRAAGPRDAVIEADDHYLVELDVADVGHPTILTTSLSRAVGALVLHEAGDVPEDIGAMSEIAAAACGFGVLLHNGSYVYGKSCGGARVHQATHLSVSELAVLLALFCRLHGVKPGVARAHLETTQREAFDEAVAWCDSNEAIVDALRDRPTVLEEGLFTIEPVRGLFGRLFGRRAEPALHDLAPRKSTRSAEEIRRFAETRALVDEALEEG